MLWIVSSSNVINVFKTSRYFRQNLGMSIMDESKTSGKEFRRDDKFAFHYLDMYRAPIYAQGNVGDLKFYVDHYIRDNSIAIYYSDNFEEFVFKHDVEMFKEKGIDNYIGYFIKEVEERYEEKKKKDELKKLEPKPKGNADMVTMNPGAVSYEDVKAYLKKKKEQNRL